VSIFDIESAQLWAYKINNIEFSAHNFELPVQEMAKNWYLTAEIRYLNHDLTISCTGNSKFWAENSILLIL
jgi:hypothetical protein